MKGTNEMKNFERELPEGYVAVKTVDAKSDKKTVVWLTVLSLLVMIPAALIPLAIFWLGGKELSGSTEGLYLAYVSVLVGMIVYMILHELVHGAVYKRLTGEKLTFGLSLTCAYCGVPHIYTYRKAALKAVIAPFAVFSVIFVAAMAVTYFVSSGAYLVLTFLFAMHISGCSGDLYVAYLLTAKYKDDSVLMNDTGPKMTIYVMEKKDNEQ